MVSDFLPTSYNLMSQILQVGIRISIQLLDFFTKTSKSQQSVLSEGLRSPGYPANTSLGVKHWQVHYGWEVNFSTVNTCANIGLFSCVIPYILLSFWSCFLVNSRKRSQYIQLQSRRSRVWSPLFSNTFS